jgi:hypothetical protein
MSLDLFTFEIDDPFKLRFHKTCIIKFHLSFHSLTNKYHINFKTEEAYEIL